MRNDRTAILLYLLSAVERLYGEPSGRFALVEWLTKQLDAGLSPEQVLERYGNEQKGSATIH